MRLGDFFTLEELTRTEVPFPNEHATAHLINLTRLVTLVLDPLREMVGPLTVTSGFRSARVNAAVGGSPTSYHLQGLAADIVHKELTPDELARKCMQFEVDKAISEHGRWVHVQVAPIGSRPRGELYQAFRDKGETVYRRMT